MGVMRCLLCEAEETAAHAGGDGFAGDVLDGVWWDFVVVSGLLPVYSRDWIFSTLIISLECDWVEPPANQHIKRTLRGLVSVECAHLCLVEVYLLESIGNDPVKDQLTCRKVSSYSKMGLAKYRR